MWTKFRTWSQTIGSNQNQQKQLKPTPEFPTYGAELESLILCKNPTKDCWFRKCLKCVNTEKLVTAILKKSRKNNGSQVSWFQWKKNKENNRFEKFSTSFQNFLSTPSSSETRQHNSKKTTKKCLIQMANLRHFKLISRKDLIVNRKTKSNQRIGTRQKCDIFFHFYFRYFIVEFKRTIYVKREFLRDKALSKNKMPANFAMIRWGQSDLYNLVTRNIWELNLKNFWIFFKYFDCFAGLKIKILKEQIRKLLILFTVTKVSVNNF